MATCCNKHERRVITVDVESHFMETAGSGRLPPHDTPFNGLAVHGLIHDHSLKSNIRFVGRYLHKSVSLY
jgi:hypothetical protein